MTCDHVVSQDERQVEGVIIVAGCGALCVPGCPPHDALEQLHTGYQFERLDPPTERRLFDIEQLRRTRNALRLGRHNYDTRWRIFMPTASQTPPSKWCFSEVVALVLIHHPAGSFTAKRTRMNQYFVLGSAAVMQIALLNWTSCC